MQRLNMALLEVAKVKRNNQSYNTRTDMTLPIEKQLRFKQQLQWAVDMYQNEQIGSYLRSLNEDEWYHFGEL